MSPPRKFSGKVKPGMGIDGTEGENFAKRGTDSWTVQPASVDYVRGDGKVRRDTVKSAGQNYTNNESGLRNKPASDQSGGVGTKEIYDNVCENSDSASKTGGTGPIKYGVD
jgi:hypothetical protein